MTAVYIAQGTLGNRMHAYHVSNHCHMKVRAKETTGHSDLVLHFRHNSVQCTFVEFGLVETFNQNLSYVFLYKSTACLPAFLGQHLSYQ